MKLTQEQVQAIRALEDRDGCIEPQRVVEAARDESSPLHDLFDWDQREASEKWWLHQARLVIGAVKVTYTTEEYVVKSPCYVVDTEAEGSRYRSVASLKKNPPAARESLIYTLEVAAGHLRRAYDLAGPLGLQDDINALVRQITGLQNKAGKKAA